MATSICGRLAMLRAAPLYPISANSSTPSDGAEIVYLPFASVVVVVFVPRTWTVTPGSRSPVIEVTVPETGVSCARALPVVVTASTRPIANAAKARMIFFSMNPSASFSRRVSA